MLNAFKLAQMINENTIVPAEDNFETYQLFGSVDEACGEVNYILACESADIEEFYANSNAILIETAMSGDQDRVRVISEASAKEIGSKIAQFFKDLIKAIRTFFGKVLQAMKDRKNKIVAWFKSKKENKDGDVLTIKDQVNKMTSVDSKGPSFTISSWNDDALDKYLYEQADLKNGEHFASIIKDMDSLYEDEMNRIADTHDIYGDEARADMRKLKDIIEEWKKEYSDKTKEVEESVKSKMDDLMELKSNGKQKNLTDVPTIQAMAKIVEEFNEGVFAPKYKEILDKVSSVERAVSEAANKVIDRNDRVAPYYVNAIKAVQSYVYAYVNGTNKLVNQCYNLLGQRNSEYMRVIDWAIKHSTSK